MNINKLNELVNSSKLNKVQIAEKCGVSRTTLDNVLAGADAKISTIESLAKVLGISIGALFGDAREDILSTSINGSSELEFYKREVERLQTLLNNQKKSTKVVVELDVDEVIQILNK